MELINIPTEQTTAATDAIVAVVATFSALYLRRLSPLNRRKTSLWSAVFWLLAIAAALGSVAHGFALSAQAKAMLWYPLYLTLGLIVAIFVVATVYDIWGDTVAGRSQRPMILVGVVFFGMTVIWPDDFIIFIIYEVVAMLFALLGYLWLGFRGSLKGAKIIAIGILISIVAAAIQAGKLVTFELIWTFDHNGVYHLIQIIGIIFLLSGLRTSIVKDKQK